MLMSSRSRCKRLMCPRCFSAPSTQCMRQHLPRNFCDSERCRPWCCVLTIWVYLLSWLWRCARSDWLRVVSCLAIITSRGVIMAGALNFKMAALRFLNVTEEMINIIRKIKFPRTKKNTTNFGVILFKRKTWSFCWFNQMTLLNSSGNWLFIFIQAIETNETKWF